MKKCLIFGGTWIGEVKASQDGQIVSYVFKYGMIPGDEFKKLAECDTIEDLKLHWSIREVAPEAVRG